MSFNAHKRSAFCCLLLCLLSQPSSAEIAPSLFKNYANGNAIKLAGTSNVYTLPELAPIEPKPAQMQAEPPPPTVRGEEEQQDQNEIYDPTNAGFKRLQKANESMAGFPLDRTGHVEWMKTLRQGIINPRADKLGTTTKEVLDMDIVMKNTKQMPYVLFPHNSHTMWLDCSNCHPAIFVPEAGANKIKMPDILRGKFCGVCHGKVSFSPLWGCERCHRVVNPDFPMNWWQ